MPVARDRARERVPDVGPLPDTTTFWRSGWSCLPGPDPSSRLAPPAPADAPLRRELGSGPSAPHLSSVWTSWRTLVLRKFTHVTSLVFLNLFPRRSEPKLHCQPVVENRDGRVMALGLKLICSGRPPCRPSCCGWPERSRRSSTATNRSAGRSRRDGTCGARPGEPWSSESSHM